MVSLDRTHEPGLRSWVPDSGPGSDFPIQNLPFGRYRSGDRSGPRIAVAIGSAVLDLHDAATRGAFGSASAGLVLASGGDLQGLMAAPAAAVRELRGELSALLSTGNAGQSLLAPCLLPAASIHMLLPTTPPDYTDFFSSIHHARNAGEIRRPGNPLLPNFHHLPVAYHGRPSTVRASGDVFNRPGGQSLPAHQSFPVHAPTQWLDFECEVAVWIGQANRWGEPIALRDAERHVFGLGLLNDWSARDLQMWETQPLGPFLSKNFLTTVSPWIVTMDALAPFRLPAAVREPGAPALLDYLDDPQDRDKGGIDLRLSVLLESRAMRRAGTGSVRLSSPNLRDQYWTVAQMVTHHTVNGCELRPGDLLGTGTVSGPTPDELGCLLEMTRCGQVPVTLPNGESRMWLDDGDRITLQGHCERDGFVPISFGEATAMVASSGVAE